MTGILYHGHALSTLMGMEHLELTVSNLEKASASLIGRTHLTAARRLKYAHSDLCVLAIETSTDLQWLVADALDHVESASTLLKAGKWTKAHDHIEQSIILLAKLA